MIIEVQGDLLSSNSKLIAHGVNCQGVMGSGVAKTIYDTHPEVREDYFQFFEAHNLNPDQILGKVQYVFIGYDLTIANCFTQQNFGRGDQVYLSYHALETCLIDLRIFMQNHNIQEMSIPKIGCGLAGGDWNQVKQILERVFPDELTVKVYSL